MDADGVIATGSTSRPALRVQDLTVTYRAARGREVKALDGLTFDVAQGETLGVVGESGCGKSTMARAVARLIPLSGTIWLGDVEFSALRGRALRTARPRVQMVFQDPISSLNPRRRTGDIIVEPLRLRGDEASVGRRLPELLDAVHLPASYADRLPHELSGGQCQRVSIARAIASQPEILICDEAVSALDVSVQAQILNLLEDVKERYGLAMVFISHDLSVVKAVSDRVLVLYAGRECETAASERLFADAAHPYTMALMSAIPSRRSWDAPDEPPSPGDTSAVPETGCTYVGRCPTAIDRCVAKRPDVVDIAPGHGVACHVAAMNASL